MENSEEQVLLHDLNLLECVIPNENYKLVRVNGIRVWFRLDGPILTIKVQSAVNKEEFLLLLCAIYGHLGRRVCVCVRFCCRVIEREFAFIDHDFTVILCNKLLQWLDFFLCEIVSIQMLQGLLVLKL